MLQVLRVRDFRLLWSARLVSSLGSWLLVIAIPAHVLALTGSLMATGLTLAAEYLPPVLLGPVAGVLTDRWDRRRLMLATDVFRAVAITLLLFASSADRLWLVYVALLAESAGTVLFRPAAQAHTPVVVGTGPLLSSANSLNAITDGAVRLLGAPLGAVLLTTAGFATLVWLDIATYLVSALAILLTARRPAPPPARTASVRAVVDDLVAGLGFLRRQPVALALLPVTATFLAANAAVSALFVPFGVDGLGGSEQAAALLSALGVGVLLGAPPARVLVDRVPAKHLLSASYAVIGVAFFLLFNSASLTTALPAGLVLGVCGAVTLTAPLTTLQRVTPNAVLGRVSAAFFTVEAVATLIGALLGPALAEATSLTFTAGIASAVTLAAAALALLLIPRVPAELAAEPVAPYDVV